MKQVSCAMRRWRGALVAAATAALVGCGASTGGNIAGELSDGTVPLLRVGLDGKVKLLPSRRPSGFVAPGPADLHRRSDSAQSPLPRLPTLDRLRWEHSTHSAANRSAPAEDSRGNVAMLNEVIKIVEGRGVDADWKAVCKSVREKLERRAKDGGDDRGVKEALVRRVVGEVVLGVHRTPPSERSKLGLEKLESFVLLVAARDPATKPDGPVGGGPDQNPSKDVMELCKRLGGLMAAFRASHPAEAEWPEPIKSGRLDAPLPDWSEHARLSAAEIVRRKFSLTLDDPLTLEQRQGVRLLPVWKQLHDEAKRSWPPKPTSSDNSYPERLQALVLGGQRISWPSGFAGEPVLAKIWGRLTFWAKFVGLRSRPHTSAMIPLEHDAGVATTPSSAPAVLAGLDLAKVAKAVRAIAAANDAAAGPRSGRLVRDLLPRLLVARVPCCRKRLGAPGTIANQRTHVDKRLRQEAAGEPWNLVDLAIFSNTRPGGNRVGAAEGDATNVLRREFAPEIEVLLTEIGAPCRLDAASGEMCCVGEEPCPLCAHKAAALKEA